MIDRSVGRYSPLTSPMGPLSLPIGQGVDAVQNLQVLDQFNRDFANLKTEGLLPKGTKMPDLNFLSGNEMSGTRSYTVGNQINISPLERSLIGDRSAPGNARSWAEEGLIHELAHTMQPLGMRSQVGNPAKRALIEGGAQAYADAATPAAYGPIPTQDTGYSGFVQGVRANKGPQWFMRGQFRK